MCEASCTKTCTYNSSSYEYCCKSSGSNFPVGAIIGIVVFVVAAIIAIILGVCYCKKSKKFFDSVSKNTSVTIVQQAQPVAQ